MQLPPQQPDVYSGNGAVAEMRTTKPKQELPVNAGMSEMDSNRDPQMPPHSARNLHELGATNT